jgi:excisionase family DNA binding protein
MPRPAPLDPDWVGLSEASRVLGVSPATIRRWSDAGRLRVFTTPGGHRRFSRSALERLLPAERHRRPSIGAAGLTPTRIARTYRRASRDMGPDLPWVLTLTDAQRMLFRERGHLLATSLLHYLDSPRPELASQHLSEALQSASEYGTVAAGMGLSLSQTVEGFLRFRAPFHQELALAARRRGFDAAETTDLLQATERAMDQLLVATMTGHGGNGHARRGRRGVASRSGSVRPRGKAADAGPA